MRLLAKVSALAASLFCVTLTSSLTASGVVHDWVSATLVVTPPAVSPGAIYSNVTTNVGTGMVPEGAGASGAKFTRMLLDDIKTTSAADFQLGRFTYSVGNFDFGALSPTTNVRFYAADGADGAPGTFLGGFNFDAMSFAPGTINRVTFDAAPFNLTLPSNFWAGAFYTFDASVTQIRANRLGQGLFNPVDVGASQDRFFWSTDSATSGASFNGDNVAGAVLDHFIPDGPPVNLGWEFVVPEPASLALLPLLMTMLRRRRCASSAPRDV